MLDCPTCVHTALPMTENPCCDCEDGEEYVNVHDALENCSAALCEYQLKYWTLAYKTARFSRMMSGDLADEDWLDEDGGGE